MIGCLRSEAAEAKAKKPYDLTVQVQIEASVGKPTPVRLIAAFVSRTLDPTLFALALPLIGSLCILPASLLWRVSPFCLGVDLLIL